MSRYSLCFVWLVAALLVPARAEDKPRPDEFVYEGRSASEWAKELKAGNVKATHALSRLGKDAIPPLMQLLKDPDEKTRTLAAAVLGNMQLDKATVPGFLSLLKDENFEVRRMAIRLLAKSVPQDAAVGAAVKEMLNDRDKAVAEAAEEVLKLGDIEPLLEEAKGSLKQADFKRTLFLVDKALAINPNDIRALEMKKRAAENLALLRAEDGARQKLDAEMAAKKKTIDALLRQAREMIEKGEFERPARILTEAQKLFPDDPAVQDLRRLLEKMPRKVGDVNPFDDGKDEKQRKKAPGAGDVNVFEKGDGEPRKKKPAAGDVDVF